MGDLYEPMWLPTQARPERKEGDATWNKLVEAAKHHRMAKEARERAKRTGNVDDLITARCEANRVRELVDEVKGQAK